MFFRFYGVEESNGIKIINPELANFSNWLNITTIIGVYLGIFYFLIEFFTERSFFRKMSMGTLLISKLMIYIIVLVTSIILAQNVAMKTLGIEDSDQDLFDRKIFWIRIVFFLFFSIIATLLRILINKFGSRVFGNLLMGKYRNPSEENRIFMFLDLRSATTLAEKLGNIKYSQLLQECFKDLNDIIPKYEGEIYQYVGDEAVITWPLKKGIRRNQCVESYFAFKNRLHQRKAVYQNKFGILPEFKAGLHGGELIVAEIGTVKQEIAYHGNVINTAARIQGQCNTYQADLLISQSLYESLDIEEGYKVNNLGPLELKGKDEKLNIIKMSRI